MSFKKSLFKKSKFKSIAKWSSSASKLLNIELNLSKIILTSKSLDSNSSFNFNKRLSTVSEKYTPLPKQI